MLKPLFLGWITVASPAYAQDLPRAISCYQDSTNAKDINAYMACFIEEAEMTDVSRSFSGQKAIAAWAEREVIPYGKRFSTGKSWNYPRAMPKPKLPG